MPKLNDLENITTKDQFKEKSLEVKAAAQEIGRKTYSLPIHHINYINQVALDMSQNKGKPVSASEALRFIIDSHKKG